MDPILDGLNAAQHAAVTSPSDILQILAPPGSGKTKTLTSRVAYLLSRHGYKPWNILCLTFTIKSAQEMRQRIARLLGNGLESRLVLGTFHSVCRRYLVSYGHLIGLDRRFGIADTSDSRAIIKRITERLKLNIDVKKAQAWISTSKSRGIRSSDLRLPSVKSKNFEQEEFTTLFRAYEAQLKTSNLLDYDDLLLNCADLLRQHPGCVSNVEAVLIDEFQDTNVVQFDLMRLFAISHQRITTVGDPDQSIYGWRSAEIKNLGRMQTQYPDTLVIQLEENYRSSAAILLAAREVIEQDNSRPSRPISPTHCPCAAPVLRKLPSTDIEARWIVSEIRRSIGMTGGLLQHVDFAILLRSASLSRQIESAMGKAGIPYRMVGGKKFFERTEIKVLLDYLQVVSQPHNSDALSRIINVPSRHIGVTTVKSLLEEADARKSSLWDLLWQMVRGHIKPRTKVSKQAEQSMGAFVNIILTSRNKVLDLAKLHFPDYVLKLIIKKLDYRAYLERNYGNDHESRWANVEELLVQASDYNSLADENIIWGVANDKLPQIEGLKQENVNAGEEALSKFLANITLATEIQRDDTSADGDAASQSQVTISTIHAAKGLEWPVIFIPSAYDGSIPHSRAEDTDEERRLLYVAMTRAQALLYISCPLKNSQRQQTKMSPFLLPKNAANLFAPKGPTLTTETVHDISLILRRGCPSESELVEGRQTLENPSDDTWPLNGEHDPEIMETIWDTGAEHYMTAYKRRRIEDDVNNDTFWGCGRTATSNTILSIGTTTTMQKNSKISHQGYNSFISATTHLQQVKEAIQETRGRTSSAGSAKLGPVSIDGSQQAKPTKMSQGQGSLLSFWAAKTHIERLPCSENTSKETFPPYRNKPTDGEQRLDEVHRREAKLPAAAPLEKPKISNPNISLAVIPHELADHKLRSTVSTRPYLTGIKHDQNVKPYVFLSSSPPRCEDVQLKTDTSATPPLADDKSSVEIVNVDVRPNDDVRPATIFHTTTVDEVRATSNPRKKTLGVRRSIAGWSARRNQGFSVPKATNT